MTGPRGGIGRRAWFRSMCLRVWGFESLRGHQVIGVKIEKPHKHQCLCGFFIARSKIQKSRTERKAIFAIKSILKAEQVNRPTSNISRREESRRFASKSATDSRQNDGNQACIRHHISTALERTHLIVENYTLSLTNSYKCTYYSCFAIAENLPGLAAKAHVAELVDAHGSGPCAFGCGGSSPSVGTK